MNTNVTEKALQHHEFLYDNPDTMFRECYEVVINVDSGNVRLKKIGYPFFRDKSADACSQVGTKEPVWGTFRNVHPELIEMIKMHTKATP